MAWSGSMSVGKASEEAFDYICSVCYRQKKTKEAVKYCVDCKDYCCQTCTDSHKMFSTLTSHNLLDVGQGLHSGSKATAFPTERCCIHNREVLDLYCENHETVACSTCIAIDHKSCPDNKIYSVPDMLDFLLKLTDSQKTQARLQQSIDSMTQLRGSTNTRLEALKSAKEKIMDQIDNFHKVLKAVIRKAAEFSRQEVEEGYKKLDSKIRQDQSNIDDSNQVLMDNDAKINKAAANKAQHFVCCKIAEKNIKMAEYKKIKQEKNDKADVKMSFITNKTLLKYVQSLHGIGEVQVGYKLGNSTDINIKVQGDKLTCSSYGCCLVNDHQLLVTDLNNKKLKRVDVKSMTVIDSCSMAGSPWGVCCISHNEAAVVCEYPNKVQFVSIQDEMKLTGLFDTSHPCYGIATYDDKIYVTGGFNNPSLDVYDMTGTLLKTILNDTSGNPLLADGSHITFNESRDKMFVGDFTTGIVFFDCKYNHLSTITDSDLSEVDGVCTDGAGNLFVVGAQSNTVVQYDEYGTKIGVVLANKDGLQSPSSVAFHQELNVLFVTMEHSDTLKMYELQ